jgi:hypothetical protein
LVNVSAAVFVDRIEYRIEATFALVTALLIFGTSYVTFLAGSRHWPLASCWLIAGLAYVGVAGLHWRRAQRA